MNGVHTVTNGGRSQGFAAKVGYAEMLRDVLVASIEKGQFPVALSGFLLIVMFWRMPSEDVTKLLFHVFDLLERGQLLGYVLAMCVALGWFSHARFQRSAIADEMQRISEQRTSLQAQVLGHRVRSSEGPL